MGETLKGFEPIYGERQGEIKHGASQETLPYPFLFCLRAKDDSHLQFFTTDFHSSTWLVEKSLGELEELRDHVGVGESWEAFIAYMRGAFESGNVKITLEGPRGAHTSAKVVAQVKKGQPRITLELSKLEGSVAHDITGAIVNNLFKVFQACSRALSAENAHVAYLSAALADEKARADRMQEQIDAANFLGKKKQRAALALPDHPPTRTPSGEKLPLRNTMMPTTQTGIPEAGKAEKVVSKRAAYSGPRVHAAMSARRGRRMGTVISTGKDDNDKK